jgi:hypothetical protein
MTDDADKPTQELTVQQRAAVGKSAPNGVSGRLKAALDDMTWNGTPWEEAALKANLTVRAMRLALKRPAVLKYLRAERGVLLASASGQNLHALAKLRDQEDNKAAAVQAARALEGLANEQFGPAQRGIGGGPRARYLIDLSDEPRPGPVIVIQPPRGSAATSRTGGRDDRRHACSRRRGSDDLSAEAVAKRGSNGSGDAQKCERFPRSDATMAPVRQSG